MALHLNTTAAYKDFQMFSREKYFVDIHDVTPWDKELMTRTEEIRAYLDANPQIYNYVILDDCFQDDYYSSDSDIQVHLVKIDALKGLQDNDPPNQPQVEFGGSL